MTITHADVEELPPPPAAPRAESAIAAVLGLSAIAVATIFSRGGAEMFRLPKELVFRAEAVVLLMLGIFWITAKRRTWRFGKRREFFLTAIIVGWTLIAAAASTNRQLSFDSLITVAAAATIFIATCLAAQGLSLIAVDVLMIGACVNAVVVILQELKIWTPFPGSDVAGTHYGSIALLGMCPMMSKRKPSTLYCTAQPCNVSTISFSIMACSAAVLGQQVLISIQPSALRR